MRRNDFTSGPSRLVLARLPRATRGGSARAWALSNAKAGIPPAGAKDGGASVTNPRQRWIGSP